VKTDQMRHEFSAVIERDDEWYIAYGPELPGASSMNALIREYRRSRYS